MKTKLIQKIKEEYFKGQPTRDLLFKGEESPRAEFGYKVRRGNEIFTVVDWGNIWNFIEKAISQSKEELVEEIKKQVENFIEDQLCHEVEPRAILGKIPRLINFILEDLNKK